MLSWGFYPLQGIHPSRRGTAFAVPPLQGRVNQACKHDRRTARLDKSFFVAAANR